MHFTMAAFQQSGLYTSMNSPTEYLRILSPMNKQQLRTIKNTGHIFMETARQGTLTLLWKEALVR